MNGIRGIGVVVAVLLGLTACGGLTPEESSDTNQVDRAAQPESVGSVGQANPLRDAYFGETHMHTAYSLDAYIGGARLTPSDAYRFAKGEAVTVDGKAHQSKRPLDFVAVSDHAEYIGEMYSTMVEGAPGHDNELLEQILSAIISNLMSP